jgi:hypothetical protein
MESTGYMRKMARPRPNAADSKCLRDALMVLTNAVNGPTTTTALLVFVLVVAAAAAPPHRNDVTDANDDVDAAADNVEVGDAATGCGHAPVLCRRLPVGSAVAESLEQQATKKYSSHAAGAIMVGA